MEISIVPISLVYIYYFVGVIHEIDQVAVNFNRDTALILNVSLGIIMFSVALELTITDFKRVLSYPKPILLGLLSQFLLLPLVTFLLVIIVNPIPSIALGMFMVAACPGGNVSNFMSAVAKANIALSVSLSAVATSLAIFLTPINFAFWSSMYPPAQEILKSVNVSTYEMIKTVFIIMAIPLVLGMWVKEKFPILTERIFKPVRILSLLIFLVIIIMALYMNFDVFWTYLYLILLLVPIHNFVALMTGFSWASLFKLSRTDVKSISIETGIQNSGLGLLLIFTFFNGLGGMALVAAGWGIWHLLSGLAVAYYWKER